MMQSIRTRCDQWTHLLEIVDANAKGEAITKLKIKMSLLFLGNLWWYFK